ncbi:MAG: patatin-like phospholipase family protein [Spirochaeta sp.]|nr:patatin-like phospholipase family protein [Spirochaeta sp.]
MLLDKKIGLALGGGAARGLAHIGVLKVLEEYDIPISCVAGTSVGSLIGAAYCSGLDWRRIREITEEISWGELVRPSLSGKGLLKTQKLDSFLRHVLGEISFADLKTPFAAVCVDIATAEEIVLTEGSVVEAVRASSSIPGIFEPVIRGERALVDGGVGNNLPSVTARTLGADIVIAVDLTPEASNREMPQNLVDVMFRTFAALMWNTAVAGKKDCDVLIQPDIAGFSYHDLSKGDDLIAAGEQAARAALGLIARKRRFFSFRVPLIDKT